MSQEITHRKVHNRFKLNGYHYSYDDMRTIAYEFIKEGNEDEIYIGEFLLDWLDDNSYVEVQTSGTTGTPKLIRLEKQAMIQSALATGDFFNLQPGNTALLCLSAKYIAGKMMIVRAIILGLELDIVVTDGKPLIEKEYDFVAMVPLQIENSIDKLVLIKKVIIGGAAVPKRLAEKIKTTTVAAFETYGMTETITHIAVRKIGEDNFKTLPNVVVKKDDRGCLVINAIKILKDEIVTNDSVEIISESEFKWLGRLDNVINSGGVKLFPEQIETKLQTTLTERFFVSGIDDEKLGKKLILVIESTEKEISSSLFDVLDKYEKPKEIVFVPQFITTATGKINRLETLEKMRLSKK